MKCGLRRDLCGNGPVFAVSQALDLGRNLKRRIVCRKFLRRKLGRWRVGPRGGDSAQGGEVFDKLDRLIEYFAKVTCGPVGKRFEAGQALWICDFPLETRYGSIGDAAGIDERKVAQIGGDVKGKAVRGDAASDMNPDRGDFAFQPCGRQRFG